MAYGEQIRPESPRPEQREMGGCCGCFTESVAIGAALIYGTAELAKWAFNGLKNFFWRVLENLGNYFKSGWEETVKLTTGLGELLGEIGLLVRDLTRPVI